MGRILLFAVPGLFCLIMLSTHFALCMGIIRSRRKEKKWNQVKRDLPRLVSVIVPARNEEKNLAALFSSLSRQTVSYFEVILVNDRSDDTTLEMMNDFKKRSGIPVEVISLKENPQSGNPKQHALLKGIEAAQGDLFLFTDADCEVPLSWIESMCRPFGDADVGVAFGAVHTKHESGFLYQYQTFDHVFRFFYNVGSAGIGSATGVYGNNMAIRASLIREIGGYSALDYSVTEDNALLSLIREKSSYRIAALSMPEVRVVAKPQDSWKALTAQELRWSTGAFFSPDAATRFGYSLVKLYLAGGFIALFFAPFFPLSLFVTLSTIVSMASIAVTGGIMLRMSSSYWFGFLPDIIWSMVYYLFVDLLAFLKVPINWKGNRLKKM